MELLARLSRWAAAHRWRYAALILAVVVLQGVVVYGVLTSTTEITTKQAVEEFRRRQQEVSAAEPVESSASPAPASVEGPAGPTTSASKARGEAQPAAQPGCEWVCATNFSAPPAGVYDWFQCGKETGQCTGADTEAAGSESFGGLGRPLPRTGRRSIIVVSANRWTSYHQYADEHKEEFDLYVDPTGVFGERYKVDIKIGPGSGGSDIRQDPAARFMQFPSALGLSWAGHWEDRNDNSDADYTGGIVDKQEVTVEGRKIRTWVVEMRMKLLGPRSTGDVFVRIWVSPESRQTIQEFYDQTVTDERGFQYRGRWMITLANLQPKS